MNEISRIEQIRIMLKDRIWSEGWQKDIKWNLEELVYDHKISKAELADALARLDWDIVIRPIS